MEGLDEFTAQLEEIRKRVTPMPEADYRRAVFEHDIATRIAAFGFEDRYHTDREVDGWNCAAQQKTFERCVGLLTATGAIVALVGPRGLGKTEIAKQLAVRRAWQDWDSWLDTPGTGAMCRATPYRKMARLVARFKPLYADYGSTDTETLLDSIDRLCRGDNLIVIDEIHECDDLVMKGRILTDVIDRRYSALNDTLLISNQTRAEFERSIGDSILSRLTEHGAILECQWKSWRNVK